MELRRQEKEIGKGIEKTGEGDCIMFRRWRGN